MVGLTRQRAGTYRRCSLRGWESDVGSLREARDLEHQLDPRAHGSSGRRGSRREQPDVLCLQETKVEDSGFPARGAARGRLRGRDLRSESYNGVAIRRASRSRTSMRGLGDGEDEEARADRGDDVRRPRRLRLRAERAGSRPREVPVQARAGIAGCARTSIAHAPHRATLVVCGDTNVTADDRDVWSPMQWAGQIHCTEPERAALRELLGVGAHRRVSQAQPRRRRLLVVGLSRRRVLQEPGPAHRPHPRDRAGRRALHRVHDRSQRAQGPGRSDHAPVVAELA